MPDTAIDVVTTYHDSLTTFDPDRLRTVLHRVAAGDEVASLYDVAMPGGTVRFAEFFEVADGRIRTLRLLYDAGDHVAKGVR